MATTTTGFQGTISDAQMATQYPHHLPSAYSATDLLVSAVNGARTVSVAAGTAIAAFIKYASDAAQQLTLAPPASGGKWYAITLNRQWSPTSTCVLQADDLGVSDANGTIPTVIAAAAVTAAQALPNQPGTAGSTAGQRQLLALVYVRAADTTLTIFDCRAYRNGAGELTVPSFHALGVLQSNLLNGAIVSIDNHLVTGAMYHMASAWQKQNGQFGIVPGSAILVFGEAASWQGLADMATFAGVLEAWWTAYNYRVVNGQRIVSGAGSEVRRQPNPQGGQLWKPWEMTWNSFTPGMAGVAYNAGAFTSLLRVMAGKLRWRFNGTVGNINNGAEITLNQLPAVLQREANLGNPLPRGTGFWFSGGVRIPIVFDFSAADAIHFLIPPGSGNYQQWIYSVCGSPVTNGWQLFMDIELDL